MFVSQPDPQLELATHPPRSGGLAREVLEALIARGLSIRQIATELSCSPGAVQYWLRKHGLKTRPGRYQRHGAGAPRTVLRECRTHGWTEHRRPGPSSGYRRMRCSSAAVAARRRKVKALLVAEGGGAYRLCGYSRFAGALQFHHLDPAQKRFQLSFNGVPRSIERLREEARKCVLLCATCHAEVEGGYARLPSSVTAEPRSGVAQSAERSAVNR